MKNQKKIGMKALLAVAFLSAVLLGAQAVSAQTSGPLQIRDVQILNTSGNTVCQHVLENGVYRLAWQSADLGGLPSVRVGDIDNDGQREIVASVYYHTRTETIKVGKRPSTIDYYNFQIHVFENLNADGEPDWSTGELGELARTLINDSYIADVDNDSLPGAFDNELVLIRSQHLEVYHFAGSTGAYERETLKVYPSFLFSLDVGDANNDGKNEIVVVPGNSSSLQIWKYSGAEPAPWQEASAAPIPPALFGPGMTYAGVTYLRIRNADNVAGNEIIATGNNQRLMVWKYEDGSYALTSVSQELSSSMAYGIDSGDIDGDGLNEVVLNLWGGKRFSARVVALAYEGGLWVQKNAFNTNYSDQRDLRMRDLDGDGKAEVVFNSGGSPTGVKVLAFSGTLAQGTFSQVYAAAGDSYQKLEVR